MYLIIGYKPNQLNKEPKAKHIEFSINRNLESIDLSIFIFLSDIIFDFKINNLN